MRSDHFQRRLFVCGAFALAQLPSSVHFIEERPVYHLQLFVSVRKVSDDIIDNHMADLLILCVTHYTGGIMKTVGYKEEKIEFCVNETSCLLNRNIA
jgi:hypothetical protein